ncbi:hypothetical protein [Amycolatopsis samaneae]|uniref:Uncharacterized protein n=1 Tax=Amycolatopsis samaneae TaxID=664691 RepID=A0ABW5G8F7_9PSEU
MTRSSWLADTVRAFTALRGTHVRSWTGVEMALREETPDGPQFEDPDVPCLQLLSLHAELDSTTTYFATHQDDDVWGLWLPSPTDAQRQDAERNDWHGIYRARPLAELPTGRVDQVALVTDEQVVAEVLLHIDGRPLLLLAGELYETAGDTLRYHRLDESVLAFTDPGAAGELNWTPPRQPPSDGC